MPALLSPRHVLPRLRATLTPEQATLLDALAEAATSVGSPLFLVGGSVRDLLLGREQFDLDFAVEADARVVARHTAASCCGDVVVHDAFRTATVTAAGLSLDLVTARREWYPSPGTLPVIEPAGIREDLARRDFSINAMALRVERGGGELVDPLGGLADLRAGILRILHPLSFRDDPTRLWRAGRYLARLGFRLAEPTALAGARDAQHMRAISPARVHHELQRTLAERRPDRALATLHRLGVLDATLPGWTCTAAEAAAVRRAHHLRDRYGDEVTLATLFAACQPEQIEMAVERLALLRRQGHALRALPVVRTALRRLAQEESPPSQAVAALEHWPPATTAALAMRWPSGRPAAIAYAYLERWRGVRPWLHAAQLQALGVPHGPAIGQTLRRLRAARLDGETATEADEVELVRRLISADERGGQPRDGENGTA